MLASPLAYDIMRESGFLILPSKRTLLDYNHWSKPQPGFQFSTFELLRKKIKVDDLNEAQRYVILLGSSPWYEI